MYCGFLSYFFVCILHIPVCFYCCLKQQHLYSLYVIVCMRELKLCCALHFVGIRMCEIVSNNLFPFVKFLNLMDLCVCVYWGGCQRKSHIYICLRLEVSLSVLSYSLEAHISFAFYYEVHFHCLLSLWAILIVLWTYAIGYLL